jgi:hypothetical protein
MENSKYKIIVENGPVEMEQMAIIHIPSTLHSDDANHIVTTTDELYDILLKKRQYQINQEQDTFNKNVDYFIDRQRNFNEEQLKFNRKQDEINIEQSNINKDVRLDIEAILLDIASAGGDIEAIKKVLKNYITREEYEEIVSELKSSISKAEENSNKYTDDKLTEYYTKEEVDDAIENAEVDLSGYYTKEQVDEAIENVEVDLTGYYTKEEVDNKFLELEIEKILNGVTTSLSIAPSGVFETNVETEITVKYNINNFTLSDKSVLSLTIKKGNEIVATGTGETISYSDKILKTTSYSATCVYKDGVKTWNGSATKNSYYRTYYGFGINEEDVFTNGHSKVTSGATGTYSEISNADNVYYYIIVPEGVFCPSTFTMYATPFVMDKSSLTKNNITYTVLKSGSNFGIGGEVNINAQ